MVFNFQHYYFILKSEELFVKECLTEKIPVLIDYIHWYIQLVYLSYNSLVELDIYETGTNSVATYQAPLQTSGLHDAVLTVVASGFLDPLNNCNGAAFGLWVALARGGTLVELPLADDRDISSIDFRQTI